MQYTKLQIDVCYYLWRAQTALIQYTGFMVSQIWQCAEVYMYQAVRHMCEHEMVLLHCIIL